MTQHFVAHRHPELLGDRGEAVEVQAQHREEALVAPGAIDLAVQLLHEHLVRRQPGERVAYGGVAAGQPAQLTVVASTKRARVSGSRSISARWAKALRVR